MSARLPTRQEYYRPTRARELRGKARSLARLREGVALGALVLLFITVQTGMGHWPGRLAFLAVCLGLFGLVFVNKGLRRLRRRLRAEADSLDRDHHARYEAELPGGAPRRR